MAKPKLTFEQTDCDPQNGCASWSIKLDNKEIGFIDKDTTWCGDGYRADCYNVTIEPMYDSDGEMIDEGADEQYHVENIWRSWGMTACQALAACKAFAREYVKKSKQ